MRKPIFLKNLFLNLTLIFLLVGLYSCGGGDNSAVEADTDTEEVIIEINDEGSANESDVYEDAESNAVVDTREDLDVSSVSKDAELELELENPGFEGTYNYSEVDEPPMFEEFDGKVAVDEREE